MTRVKKFDLINLSCLRFWCCMKRREACELLNCHLLGLATKLNISDSAVAQWGDDRDIPKLREYQVLELVHSNSLKSNENLDHSATLKYIQN